MQLEFLFRKIPKNRGCMYVCWMYIRKVCSKLNKSVSIIKGALKFGGRFFPNALLNT